MKNIFLVVVLICFHGLSWAQTQQPQQTQAGQPPDQEADLYTNAEKFADSAGRLIQKEYVPSGHILSCNIQVVHLTDLVNGSRRNALRFVNNQNQDVYLDEDEVGALTVSMYAIRDKVLPTNPANYTEVKYKSRSRFEAGCFYEQGKWKLYFELNRHDSSTTVEMKKSDFDIFLQILDNLKTKFNQ
jgi:hypothetical protein